AREELNAPKACQDRFVENRGRYAEVMSKLCNLQPVDYEFDRCVPVELGITPDAMTLLERWHVEHMRDGNLSTEPIQSAFSKLKGFCPQLALILHMARIVSGETQSPDVDEDSMRCAIVITEYFKAHAHRVQAFLVRKGATASKVYEKIIKWAVKRG